MNNIEIMRPFGPSLLKSKMSEDLLELLIKKTDGILNDPVLSEKYDWSSHLAGNVQKEVRFENNWLTTPEAAPFANYITQQTDLYLNDHHVNAFFDNTVKKENKKHPFKKINMSSAWMVSQWNGDFNPIHTHDGYLSGVCYLKMPDMNTKIENEDHTRTCAKIAFISGNPNYMSLHQYVVLPEPGDFFLFPSWLMHTVYPFRTPDTERRSVSFNLFLE